MARKDLDRGLSRTHRQQLSIMAGATSCTGPALVCEFFRVVADAGVRRSAQCRQDNAPPMALWKARETGGKAMIFQGAELSCKNPVDRLECGPYMPLHRRERRFISFVHSVANIDGQLVPRLERAGGDGCPALVFGGADGWLIWRWFGSLTLLV